MGTEIFKIDASWAEKLTKTRVSFLMTPTVGHPRVTTGHLRATMGHLRLTIGYLKATVVHIRVTSGHLKVTIGYFFLSANIRQTQLSFTSK